MRFPAARAARTGVPASSSQAPARTAHTRIQDNLIPLHPLTSTHSCFQVLRIPRQKPPTALLSDAPPRAIHQAGTSTRHPPV